MYFKFVLFALFSFVINFAFADIIENNKESSLHNKEFYATFSVDNKIKSSQNAGTDVALTLVNGLAYLGDKYDWNENIFQRLISGYGTFVIALWNHEISGHTLRGNEFGKKTTGFRWDGPFSAATEFGKAKNLHLQKKAIINMGGIEANVILSQKISDELINNYQDLSPITASSYIFSSGNQTAYIYMFNSKGKGHDIRAYERQVQKIYGKGSVTSKKIKSLGYLDLLDPMLFASLYSWGSGDDVHLPFIKVIEGIEIMPSTRLVLTPYGVLEKRLTVHMKTNYTPVKVSFGFGKESKTSQPFGPDGLFTGSNGPIKKNNTYYGELVISKILALSKLNIGVTLAGWKQPGLFTNNPYDAKIKKGGMAILNSLYTVNNDLKISCDLGYKSKGFVLGTPTAKTPIIRLGLQWKL